MREIRHITGLYDYLDELARRHPRLILDNGASFAINFRDPAAVEALRQHLLHYLKVRSLFTKDYCPLTPWSLDPARLLAFQFHDRASGDGMVQVFCGSGATDGVIRLRLRGLGSTSRYAVTDWDGPAQLSSFTGVQLMSEGLPVMVPRDRAALVLQYSLRTNSS